MKNFFKEAKKFASLGCNLSTKGESERQSVGNSDKYILCPQKEKTTMQKSLKPLIRSGFT